MAVFEELPSPAAVKEKQKEKFKTLYIFYDFK